MDDKRIALTVTAVLAASSLAACTSNEDGAASPSPSSSVTDSETKRVRVTASFDLAIENCYAESAGDSSTSPKPEVTIRDVDSTVIAMSEARIASEEEAGTDRCVVGTVIAGVPVQTFYQIELDGPEGETHSKVVEDDGSDPMHVQFLLN
ncbi:hypothetical protein PU560_07365 [Georgenia sp. 10Sc9-8]|uniref:Lipoprotein n=1 Tax=Georgenia halotolerans TaxID=3028317 RepID=A0ABT5TW48_9MICO|nr:hypothetical protein [Georgenia halotolerans]